MTDGRVPIDTSGMTAAGLAALLSRVEWVEDLREPTSVAIHDPGPALPGPDPIGRLTPDGRLVRGP